MKYFFLIITLALISLISCTPSIKKIRQPKDLTDFPEIIRIYIKVDNYKIINERLDPRSIFPLDGIRFSGKYSNNRVAYFRFDSVPSSYTYWLAEVPPFKQGEFILEAKKMALDVTEIPKIIEVTVIIEKRKIVHLVIKNFSGNTEELYRDRYETTREGKVAILKSKIFPGEEWAMLLPKKDGKFILTAQKL